MAQPYIEFERIGPVTGYGPIVGEHDDYFVVTSGDAVLVADNLGVKPDGNHIFKGYPVS